MAFSKLNQSAQLTRSAKISSPSAAASALSGDFGVYSRTAGYIMRSMTRFEYDGTTLDLVLKALKAGAEVGDRLTTPGIGRAAVGWELTSAGGGGRTPGGVWATRGR